MLFYKKEASRGYGGGVGLCQEGPIGACSVTIEEPPTATWFDPDEGRVPRE